MTPMEADIMDITTLSVKTKFRKVVHRNISRKAYLAIGLGALSPCVYAELDITGSAQGKSIFQEVERQDEDTLSLTTFSVIPQVNATYQTRTFSGLWSGTLTHLERDNDDIAQTQDYAEYSYSAQWAPMGRALVFQATGALNYRNGDSSSFLVSDFLTNSNSLAKTRNNTLSSSLLIENNNWVNAQGSASYSDVASESTSANDTQIGRAHV